MEPVIPATHKWTADEIEKCLENLPPLKLKGYEHNKMKCSEFLKLFFKTLNAKYSTIEAVTEKLQCPPGKRRSITDIYRLLKFYYPRTASIPLIAKLMTGILEKNEARSNICTMVNRRVYMHSPSSNSANTKQADEFGLTSEEFLAFASLHTPKEAVKKTPVKRAPRKKIVKES